MRKTIYDLNPNLKTKPKAEPITKPKGRPKKDAKIKTK
tara:strand:- start:753 stop:866 length:114 start_codon:yes stop_codon:yes gene_type:complete